MPPLIPMNSLETASLSLLQQSTGQTSSVPSSVESYRLPRRAEDDTEFQLAFAPSDCHAYVMLPVYDGRRMITRITERMGEVVLFSMSSHRDKFPVSRLGRVLPVGFTAGRRTVAGTIGLTLWDRNALRRVSQRLYRAYPQFVAAPHADEFPPLDIVLVFVNETGNVVSVTLYGVTILDEGVTLQTDDIRSVVTFSYMAVDYEINHSPLKAQRQSGESAPVTTAPDLDGVLDSVVANRFEVAPTGRPGSKTLSLLALYDQSISQPPVPSGAVEMSASQLDMNLLGEWVDRPLPSFMDLR